MLVNRGTPRTGVPQNALMNATAKQISKVKGASGNRNSPDLTSPNQYNNRYAPCFLPLSCVPLTLSHVHAVAAERTTQRTRHIHLLCHTVFLCHKRKKTLSRFFLEF